MYIYGLFRLGEVLSKPFRAFRAYHTNAKVCWFSLVNNVSRPPSSIPNKDLNRAVAFCQLINAIYQQGTRRTNMRYGHDNTLKKGIKYSRLSNTRINPGTWIRRFTSRGDNRFPDRNRIVQMQRYSDEIRVKLR